MFGEIRPRGKIKTHDLTHGTCLRAAGVNDIRYKKDLVYNIGQQHGNKRYALNEKKNILAYLAAWPNDYVSKMWPELKL